MPFALASLPAALLLFLCPAAGAPRTEPRPGLRRNLDSPGSAGTSTPSGRRPAAKKTGSSSCSVRTTSHGSNRSGCEIVRSTSLTFAVWRAVSTLSTTTSTGRRDFVSVHCDQVTAYNPAPVVLRPLPLASRDAASISWAGSSTVAAAVSCTVVPSRRSVTPASPTGSAQPSSTTQRRKPSCQTSGSYTQQLDAATPGLLQSTGTHTSPPREGASACI